MNPFARRGYGNKPKGPKTPAQIAAAKRRHQREQNNRDALAAALSVLARKPEDAE